MEYQVTISGEEFEKLKAAGDKVVIMDYNLPKNEKHRLRILTVHEAVISLTEQKMALLKDMQKLSDRIEEMEQWILENCTKRQINRFIKYCQ